jgi:Ca2+-binding RTX toxin-like protein
MTTPVTVQSAHSTTVTLTYNSSANASLAEYVAAAIQAGIGGGSVLAESSAYGIAPSIPVGKTGEWVETLTTPTTLATRYDYIVDAAANANITGPNDSNVQVIAGSGNLIFNPSLGAGSLIAGDGNDNFTVSSVGSGAWTVILGDGTDTVRVLNGANDSISTGIGHDSILLGSGHSTVNTSGTDTITATTGSETVTASGSDLVYGGASKLNFLATAGGATVYGGSGSDTVTGHSGPDYFQGGSGGNNSLTGGTGAATLIGGGGGDQLFARGSGAQILYASSGNETLSGGSATGADTFVGGVGHTTIAASASATNTFEFLSSVSGGTDIVQGLSLASQVKIHLSGYGAGVETAALAGQNNTGGSTTIGLGDGTTITFQNVATLTTSNFS